MIEGEGIFYAKLLLQLYMLMYLLYYASNVIVDYMSLKFDNLPINRMIMSAVTAVGPVMYLAPFGLVQAIGGATGFCTWAGLLLTMLTTFINTWTILIVPLLTGKSVGADMKMGTIPFDDESFTDPKSAKLWSMFLKVVSVLSLLGGLMLIFSSLPSGVALGCCSVCLRTNVFANLVVIPGCELAGLVSSNPAIKKLMCASFTAMGSLSFVPIASALALVDNSVWGPSSFMYFLIHPMFYFMLWLVAQFALLLGLPLLLGLEPRLGRVEGSFECQAETKELGTKLALNGVVAPVVLYSSLALMTLRSIFGIFSISITREGITLITGPLMVMAAVFVLSIFVSIYGLIFFLNMVREFTGFEWCLMSCSIENMKACVTYIPAIAFTLIAIHETLPEPSSGFTGNFVWLLFFPTTYGIMLSAGSLILPVVAALPVALMMGKPTDFDANGFPEGLEGMLPPKIVNAFQILFALCLYGGMLLGFLGLGLLVWGSIFLIIVALKHKELTVAVKSGIEQAQPTLANWKETVNKASAESSGVQKQAMDVVAKVLGALENLMDTIQKKPNEEKKDPKKKK